MAHLGSAMSSDTASRWLLEVVAVQGWSQQRRWCLLTTAASSTAETVRWTVAGFLRSNGQTNMSVVFAVV